MVIDPHPFLYAARRRPLAVTPDQVWVRLDPQGALYAAPVKVFSPASCGSSASLKPCWIRDRSPIGRFLRPDATVQEFTPSVCRTNV